MDMRSKPKIKITLIDQKGEHGCHRGHKVGDSFDYDTERGQLCPMAAMKERRHGDTKDTPLIHKLSMETYNKHYAPCRTESDWLCANPDAQDAYIADPLCGDGFTVSSFRELLSAMKVCSTAEHLSHMNPSVPVLFLSGKEDAVGNFGKGVEKAAELFHNAHMKDVTVQLFDGMRHDIFREKEAGKVCEYLYGWMDERKTTGCRDI